MPTEEERQKIFVSGPHDSPDDALHNVEFEMRRAEAEAKRKYAKGLEETDPNSLAGQVIRRFPPMSGQQLMEKLAGARVESSMTPLNAINDPAPTLTSAQGPKPGPAETVRDVFLAEEPKLQFFDFTHLPPHFQAISRPFESLAHLLVVMLPRNPERTIALNLLCQAKDAAVRAKLYKEPPKKEPEKEPSK